MTDVQVDALTVGFVWSKLDAIADEMGETLRRTAYSDAVREGRDFSAALFDRRGRLLAQADLSPGHLGAVPDAVRNMLRPFRRDSLRPGDVITMNDAYLGSGHLPDFYSLSPVFHQGEICGYVVVSAHLVDVGGMRPGSQSVEGVVDMFQEGLRIPPVMLYRAGVPNEDLFSVIGGNVRVPDKVLGDLRAQRNALDRGASAVSELFAQYGAEVIETSAEAFLDSSERMVRQGLAEIPDGVYRFHDYFDDVGPGTDPVRIEVAVTINGSDIEFDFTGTDPQTRSAINSPLNFTKAYCYWATKALTTGSSISQNDGQLRPVTVKAPKRSFVNPEYPAAAGGRAVLNQWIVEVIFGALAEVVPEKVTACSGQWSNPTFGGVNPRTGEPFVFYDYTVGGVGARLDSDGVSAMSPVFSLENVPVEIQEQHYPILVERLELMTDSGGAGRTRGGLSIRKDIRMLADNVELSNLTDRHRNAGYGLYGGKPGTLGSTLINPGPEERILESKASTTLAKGDVVSFRCSGSGGFGPPRERPRELVARDLAEGYISRDAAIRDYGYVPCDDPSRSMAREGDHRNESAKETS